MIDDNIQVGKMFDFQTNMIHAKCNFETVRKLYKKLIERQYLQGE